MYLILRNLKIDDSAGSCVCPVTAMTYVPSLLNSFLTNAAFVIEIEIKLL